MIEGGGLGVFAPEEVGPVSVQVPNGVVDVLCADEQEAVEAAKQYLSYFQGDVADWTAPDQELLRDVVPPDRRRVYDVHAAHRRAGRRGVGARAAAVVRPGHGHGAGPDRGPGGRGDRQQPAAPGRRHRRRQRRQGGPLPAAVRGVRPAGALAVRHAGVHGGARGGGDGPGAPRVSRMFVVGASLTVPFCCVVLRKGYGLGAQAMAGGSFRRPLFTVAWPTGELGGMGLEGAVRLGFRRELDAIEDPEEREAAFSAMVVPGLRARQGAQRGGALRNRRRHRPGGDADPLRPRAGGGRGGTHWPARSGRTAAVRGHLVREDRAGG